MDKDGVAVDNDPVFFLESEEEKFEAEVLKIDEEYRDLYREARFYPDELYQELFQPPQPFNLWTQTKDYTIFVSK